MVHLRTHRETTVGKVMGSCLDFLGVTENQGLFGPRNMEGDGPFGKMWLSLPPDPHPFFAGGSNWE